MDMNTIGTFLVSVWAMWEVKFVTFHVLLNLIIAVYESARSGTFELVRLGDFLYKRILPYVLIFVFCKLFVSAMPEAALLSVAVWVIIETNLLSNTADNLKKLGINIPDGIMRNIKA